MLVIAGVVAALPLSVGFLLIQHTAKTRLADATATNFVWFAEHAASQIDLTFVRELEFLAALSRAIQPLPDEKVPGILQAAESALHRNLAVVDRSGSLVATSDPSGFDFEPGQETIRRAFTRIDTGSEAFAEWRGGDEHVLLFRAIRGQGGERAAGVLLAAMDSERLFSAISDFRFGETGHACLVEKETGRVVAGSKAVCATDGSYARFREYERSSSGDTRYFLGSVTGPSSFDRADAFLVAHARPNLAAVLPELDWVVLVEQSLDEAQRPLAPLARELILYFLGMGVLVVLLAAYLSYRLERAETDVDLDLH